MDENAFPYAILEATLIRFFLPDGDVLPFRARLKNLQRLGLTPSSPGKGNHQSYTYSNLCDYALALMLAEFGLEPRKIVEQIAAGQAAAAAEGSYCIYYPEYFTKGKSNLQFVSIDVVRMLVEKLPRSAVIKIDEMKWMLKADLQGIIEKMEQSDGGP